MRRRTSAIASALLVSLFLALPLFAEKREQARATQGEGEDYFIISSVDIKKKQLVLKRPTEVTELMLVTEKTAYVDEHGKPLQFKALRAGDTVYVTSTRNGDGTRVATRLRRGPMTPEELRRRYLHTVTSAE